jgi:phenylalanine-4-hydroxylase
MAFAFVIDPANPAKQPPPHEKKTSGQPIPRIDYTAEETAVWATALRELNRLFPSAACAEFLRAYRLFDFREDSVPQLQDVSDVLEATTGWRVRL